MASIERRSLRWGVMVLAGVVMQWTALVVAATQTERYGKTLLLEHRLPESVVQAFNR